MSGTPCPEETERSKIQIILDEEINEVFHSCSIAADLSVLKDLKYTFISNDKKSCKISFSCQEPHVL